MFVTMINLLPVGQLDGGHVAYALFGPKQDRYAQLVHRSMLAFFFVDRLRSRRPRRRARARGHVVLLGRHLANALFWLVWFQVARDPRARSRRAVATHEPKPEQRSRSARASSRRSASSSSRASRATTARRSPLAFFAASAMLVAMEIKGGVLRRMICWITRPRARAARRARAVIAVLTLVVFALLFMPEPFTM